MWEESTGQLKFTGSGIRVGHQVTALRQVNISGDEEAAWRVCTGTMNFSGYYQRIV